MKLLLEIVLALLAHPIAVVLAGIDPTQHDDLSRTKKLRGEVMIWTGIRGADHAGFGYLYLLSRQSPVFPPGSLRIEKTAIGTGTSSGPLRMLSRWATGWWSGTSISTYRS